MKMSQSRVTTFTLTIPAGQTTSNVARAWETYGNSAGLIIQSPATLPETVTIQVSNDNGASWGAFQDGSPLADVTTPAAGKAAVYDRLAIAQQFRLVAGAAAGGNRVFSISFASLY